MESPHLLIVEDDKDLAAAYERWLAGQYTVEVAHTSQRALDYITAPDTPNPDITFLDRGMPDFSGDELLTQLRAAGFDGWVVMVTGKTPTEAVTELAFDAYIQKPVEQGDLRSVVETIQDRAEYNEKVREYVATMNKMAVLRDSMSADRIEDNAFYQELQDHADDLLSEIDETAAELDDLVLTPGQLSD